MHHKAYLTQKIVLPVAFLLLASGILASAQTLISESFSGGSASLNEKTPSYVDPALSGTTWQAPSTGYTQNGAISTSDTKAVLNIGSFIDDQKGQANAIFRVSATVDPTAGGNNWIAVGFYGSTYNINQSGISSAAGVTLYRDSGDAEGYTSVGGAGIVRADFATGSGFETYGVTLDLSQWDGSTNYGSIIFSMGAASTTPYALTADVSFTAIGIGTPSSGKGNITNFEFSQIPEPETYAFAIGLLGLVIICVRCRKR